MRRYCGKIDALSQELQACKRQLILQEKKSERALADLAATGADEIAAVHHHYSILIKDLEKKMQDMQAQIDAEQNMKRDWTQAQRKNIQSARSQAEKFTVLQVSLAHHAEEICTCNNDAAIFSSLFCSTHATPPCSRPRSWTPSFQSNCTATKCRPTASQPWRVTMLR